MQGSEVHGSKDNGLRRLSEGGLTNTDRIVLSGEVVSGVLGGSENLLAELDSWLARTGCAVAVRSSAIGEDGASMSFAGMFDSRLGVDPTIDNVLKAIDHVSASGSSQRVESYGGASRPRIPVVIQKMVSPIISGVSFTSAVGADGEKCCYSEWVEGLGEQLVSGRTTPSRIVIPWGSASIKLDRSAVSMFGRAVHNDDLGMLCDAVDRLCQIYEGNWDVEWSIDGEGSLWLLQLRPVTRPILVPSTETPFSPIAASPGVASGSAFLVNDDGDTSNLQEGDVLVAETTEVDFVPAMKRAAAIVTEQGGMLSHAAIVAREFGKPCVVGVSGALSVLRANFETTVDGTSGIVRQGSLLLGSTQPQEIDWRALCLYDRGFEMVAAGHSLYIEALPVGIVAYTADEIGTSNIAEIERELRKYFQRNVSVVQDQKLMWFWEWQRFNQLNTVSYLEAMFKTSLARWDRNELARVIDAVKKIAAASAVEHHQSKIHELYLRELGAALHALCGVVVEGLGAWGSFRDTFLWRQTESVNYNEMLAVSLANPNANRF